VHRRIAVTVRQNAALFPCIAAPQGRVAAMRTRIAAMSADIAAPWACIRGMKLFMEPLIARLPRIEGQLRRCAPVSLR
jgi:hypothetical protein